ncbi:antirestriction protein ArdA [Pseudonocardia nematodicida]|uniref:Antirestriction protein ArdA n=1 Tax=Pseudonocardia nematodicida TaxID=1206997 RepID=A0ABV1KCZ6_9PSEU
MERHHTPEGGEHDYDTPRFDFTGEQPTDELPRLDPEDNDRLDPPRIRLVDASAGVPEDEPPVSIWLDADTNREDLEEAVHDLLRASPSDGPHGYRIAETRGFEGFTITEHEDLGTVARVARGIARHGRAFVAYLDYVGAVTPEAVDAFPGYYAGSYPDVGAWARTVADELGWTTQLDETVQQPLRDYLAIDYQRFGRDLTYDHHVVEDGEARAIYVFRLHV